MKTACLVVLAVVALTQGAAARSDHRLGVIAGLSSSNISQVKGIPFKSRSGLALGTFFDHSVGEGVYLRYEGLYIQKGGKVAESPTNYGLRTSYIESSVLLKLAGGDHSGEFSFIAGPTLAYLIEAKTESDLGSQDLTEWIESSDIGFALGVGFRIGKLTLDGRYTFGLTDITVDEESDVKNSGLLLSIGLSVPLEG
jgi:hypothetical protein